FGQISLVFAFVMFLNGRWNRRDAIICAAPGGNIGKLLALLAELGYRGGPQTDAASYSLQPGSSLYMWAPSGLKLGEKLYGARRATIESGGTDAVRLGGTSTLVQYIRKHLPGCNDSPYLGPQPFTARGKGLLGAGTALAAGFVLTVGSFLMFR